MEEKKKTLNFTLVGRPVIVGKPDLFGSEVEGEFVFRVPTTGDMNQVAGLTAAYWQRLGVSDPGTVDLNPYLVVRSLSYFSVLALKKPEWFTEEVEAGSLQEVGIVRALGVAQEVLEERKKKSQVTSEPLSSAPSSSDATS